MNEPENFSHVALTADLFRAIHAYLGQRPAAETGRLLLALESSPACNVTSVPQEVISEATPAPASVTA